MLFDPVLSTLLKPIVSLDRTFSEWIQKTENTSTSLSS